MQRSSRVSTTVSKGKESSMMKRLKRLVRVLDDGLEALIFDRFLHGRGKAFVVIACLAAFGACLWTGASPLSTTADHGETTDLKWLQNRPWWDKYPNDPRAKYHVYLFTKNRNIGAYVEVTAYRANYEFFLYKVVGSKLVYFFPENKQKGMTKIDIAEAREGSFDLRLNFEADPRGGERPKKYFSWKKIKGEGPEAVMLERLEKAIAELPDDFR